MALTLMSCKKQNSFISNELNGTQIKILVEDALKGEQESLKRLEGLLTFIPDKENIYNKIVIDSIFINNKKLYSIIFEHPNPVYNLFAIVDKNLTLLLKDESLNGFITANWKKSGSKVFAEVNEDFVSRDNIKLNRVSYYLIDPIWCDLVFRQFTDIKLFDKRSSQVITFFSDTLISTQITGNLPKPSKEKKDYHRYNTQKNKYLSSNNYFDSLVVKIIREYEVEVTQSQITGNEPILSRISDDQISNSNVSNKGIEITDRDFEIMLDNQWKKLRRFITSTNLKKELTGIKFINTKIGAGISLIKISADDKAENYTDLKFTEQQNENSRFRVSEISEAGKTYFRIYEFTCPSKKILFILEAPKLTYNNLKHIYDSIINSFLIKC
jgi:hypothetical protein